LNKRITIREDGRKRSLSKFEVLVLTMLNKALQGDVKTQIALFGLLRSFGMIGRVRVVRSEEPRKNGGAPSHFRTGLCRRNSLLTGKTTGNFDILADGIEIQRATQGQNQRVAEVFPEQRSRDFLLLNRES
jgi:hypothetical protein